MEHPSGEAQMKSEVPAGRGGGDTGGKAMKVLVAVDESEGSLFALSWVLHNLYVEGGVVGGLVLLHVLQPFQHFAYPPGPASYATAGVVDSVKKAQQQNSEALLARAAQMCRQNKHVVEPQCVLLEGDPKEMICQAVENMHIDLAVVGSRGLGKIKRAFLGSVSDYCAHHAKCPVLIVKPPLMHH